MYTRGQKSLQFSGGTYNWTRREVRKPHSQNCGQPFCLRSHVRKVPRAKSRFEHLNSQNSVRSLFVLSSFLSTIYDGPRRNWNIRNKLRRLFFCHPTSFIHLLMWMCMYYVCMHLCVYSSENARAHRPGAVFSRFSLGILSVCSLSPSRGSSFRENGEHRTAGHAHPILPRDPPWRGSHLVGDRSSSLRDTRA